jgi:hypothetical protein
MLAAPADDKGKHIYETQTLMFVVLAVVPPLLVALGIRTSIGLFQLKPWARKGALLWGVLAFVMSSLVIAFQPYETFVIREEFVSPVVSIKQLLSISFVIFTFPLGAWWIFYFTRSRVVKQFQPQALSNPASTSN